jgi:hypothetical protein
MLQGDFPISKMLSRFFFDFSQHHREKTSSGRGFIPHAEASESCQIPRKARAFIP